MCACVCVCVFLFFFFTRFGTSFTVTATVYTLCMNSSQSLTCQTIFSPLVHIVHCLQTHKFHFSATFSLKMCPTVLFTNFKNYLTTVFFSFQFQFSAVSKQTLNPQSPWHQVPHLVELCPVELPISTHLAKPTIQLEH